MYARGKTYIGKIRKGFYRRVAAFPQIFFSHRSFGYANFLYVLYAKEAFAFHVKSLYCTKVETTGKVVLRTLWCRYF